jgi:hypothetical protein
LLAGQEEEEAKRVAEFEGRGWGWRWREVTVEPIDWGLKGGKGESSLELSATSAGSFYKRAKFRSKYLLF